MFHSITYVSLDIQYLLLATLIIWSSVALKLVHYLYRLIGLCNLSCSITCLATSSSFHMIIVINVDWWLVSLTTSNKMFKVVYGRLIFHNNAHMGHTRLVTFKYIWTSHLFKNDKGCALMGTKTSHDYSKTNNTNIHNFQCLYLMFANRHIV